MLQTATNPKTGAKVALINGKWEDVTHGHPALDAGPVDSFLIGAGRQLDRFGAGAGNLIDLAQGDFASIDERAAEQSEADRLISPLQEEHPIATTAGEIAPFLATAPISGVAGQFAAGAALTGLDHQSDPGSQIGAAPVGGVVDIVANSLFGGAGRMASRVSNAITNKAARQAAEETTTRAATESIEDIRLGDNPTPRAEHERLIQAGEELGMSFTPGQKANNPQQLQFEASLSSTPGMGARFQSQADNNRQVGEVLIGRHLGLGDVTQMTQQEIGQAHDLVQQAFEQVASDMKPVKLPESFFSTLERGKNNQLSELNQLDSRFRSNVEPFFDNFLKQARSRNNELVQPQQLMKWRSDLADLMKQAGEPGSQLSGSQPSISMMIDALDGVIKGAAGKELAGVYNQARGRWRVLKTIENARAVDAGGQGISPKKIATALSKEFPEEFGRGKLNTTNSPDNGLAQIMDWARAMSASKEVVGNSGTATRMFIQNALSDPGGAIINSALGNAVGRGYEAIAPHIPESMMRLGVPQVPVPGGTGGSLPPPNAGFSPLGLPNLGGAAAVGAGSTLQ